jgi:4-hydroxybenzoate polyprenyltransferase
MMMSYLKAIAQIPEKIIDAFENEQVSLSYYGIAFLFAMTWRNFFESYSQRRANYLDMLDLTRLNQAVLHFYLSYIVLALAIMALLSYVTRVPLASTARVVLASFILLPLAPLLDLLLTRGQGIDIFYLDPHDHLPLLKLYFSYSSQFEGASLGQKIEIALGLIGCFSYFRIKKLNLLYSLFYTWVVYSIIFAVGASPYLIQGILASLGFVYTYSSLTMIRFYAITLFALLGILAYLISPRIFKTLCKDMRWLRMMHYELMLLLGVTLALTNNTLSLEIQLHSPPDTLINIALCAISIFFAGLFSIITNNLADIDIDQISNPHRPLTAGLIKKNHYTHIGYLALVLSFFYALLVNIKAAMLIGVTMSSYFFYSMPPFRFKRILLLSKSLIALNSIALVMLGYLLIQHTLNGFPNVLFFIFLIGYTCSANFIDLKDTAGDLQGGIMTVPLILSTRLSKVLIGLSCWLTSLSFFYLLHRIEALPMLFLAGGIQYYFINKTPYREWQMLSFYNVIVLSLILYLFYLKPFHL